MSEPCAIAFNSHTELRGAAVDWDDLWRRSDVALPLARAEFIAQFAETLAELAGFVRSQSNREDAWSRHCRSWNVASCDWLRHGRSLPIRTPGLAICCLIRMPMAMPFSRNWLRRSEQCASRFFAWTA